MVLRAALLCGPLRSRALCRHLLCCRLLRTGLWYCAALLAVISNVFCELRGPGRCTLLGCTRLWVAARQLIVVAELEPRIKLISRAGWARFLAALCYRGQRSSFVFSELSLLAFVTA